jgi:hypothetical protein
MVAASAPPAAGSGFAIFTPPTPLIALTAPAPTLPASPPP